MIPPKKNAPAHDIDEADIDEHAVAEVVRKSPTPRPPAVPQRAPFERKVPPVHLSWVRSPDSPPTNVWPSLPVTVGACILAILATALGRWVNPQIFGYLVIGIQAWVDEPWRLVTTAFLHGGVLHLLFNVMWLLLLASRFEVAFGPVRTAAVIALSAAFGAAAEFVFSGSPAVGLSGVVYAFFGYAWIAQKRDWLFAYAVSPSTIRWMVGWFFFCIATTITGIMPVANWAHGAGLVFGMLLGWPVAQPTTLARVGSGVLIFVLMAATWFVPRYLHADEIQMLELMRQLGSGAAVRF